MVNYQLGKVYKIVGNGFIYVGSTTRPLLCKRLAGHNGMFRCFQNGILNHYYTSFKCLADENHYIELLELFPCNSKDELHTCERKWIEQLDCVNKHIPLRTDKEYYEDNKEKILKQTSHYRKENKEKIKEYHKQYYFDNKDKILKQTSHYRKENNDKIKEYHRNRYQAKKAITEQKQY
jgi:hypothetical protein